MAELADALASGASDRKVIQVQVLLSAPGRGRYMLSASSFFPYDVIPVLFKQKKQVLRRNVTPAIFFIVMRE